MKKTLSTTFLVGSLALGNPNAQAGEEGNHIRTIDSGTKNTLVITKEKTMIVIDDNHKNTLAETDRQAKIKEIIAETITRLSDGKIDATTEKELRTVVEDPEFQEKLYAIVKNEKVWSIESISLSLLLGMLYAWAYFFTIRKIRDKGMPVDTKSFSIFGGTSGMMALLNGFVPGSLVYVESFVLALASVYLHLQNKKNGVPYEDGLFEKFAHNIPLPVVRYSKDGLPLIWNEQMQNETGYSHDDVMKYYEKYGDIMTLLYAGDNLNKVRQYLGEIEESGNGYRNIAFIMKTKSGEEKTFLWATLPDGSGGTVRIATHLTNIGEIDLELEKTKELLRRDVMTGCYNRRALEEDLRYILSNKKRKTDQSNMIMIMMDIDNFKSYNDIHGHEFGDNVLKKISHFLQVNLRDGDKIYRLGGDEFILLLESDNFDGTMEKINKIRYDFFRQEIITKNKKIVSSVGTSWGALEFNPEYSVDNDVPMGVDSIIRDLHAQIDEYMYAVKYYRLIKDELIAKRKILPEWLDKNGIGKPVFDAQKSIIGIEIFNEYGSFTLEIEEMSLIQMRKEQQQATLRE